MQYIDINLPTIIEARDNHYLFMRYIIKKKLNGNAFSELPPISNMNKINKVTGIKSTISKFLNNEDNLRKVLIGTPDELDTIKEKFMWFFLFYSLILICKPNITKSPHLLQILKYLWTLLI